MTQITKDHVEWVVVGRLRLMLEEQPHQVFNVTQTYALFAPILCWVMQRIRIKSHAINNQDDKNAHNLGKKLEGVPAADAPWKIHTAPTTRIETLGSTRVVLPAPQGFAEHSAQRFLINMRDAIAHGDARIVEPFNTGGLLVGFSFSCAEFEGRGRDQRMVWEGKITLLEADMRRVGTHLARIYCDAIRHSERHRRDEHFGGDAGSIKETAA
jgi:hypothetical protein